MSTLPCVTMCLADARVTVEVEEEAAPVCSQSGKTQSTWKIGVGVLMCAALFMLPVQR